MSTKSEIVNNNTCVVCYKNVDVYSIGMCEHPVCYECSTRMRVLCRQNECPICRQDLPNVVFTKEIKPFEDLKKGNLVEIQYNIYFDSSDIQKKFYNLLSDTCTICSQTQTFSNFKELKDHMRRVHELHYCDLCVDNLKIFSRERRCYSRADLSQHRRKGDTDDKSHKGHPLCEFCDQRYMDNDELYRHLRRDHLYCHFCDADGLHQYYSSYDYLRDHFRHEHYLCEEGACLEEKFTSVFRTDIDLRVHKANVHGKQLGKAAAKQARTLELEFTLTPRRENKPRNRFGDNPAPSTFVDYGTRSTPEVDVQSTEQFPTLGNAVPFVPNVVQNSRNNVTIRSRLRPQPLAIDDENFPALGPESNPSTSKTLNFSLTSGYKSSTNGQQAQQNSAPNVSIRVNHESNGTVTTRVSGPNIKIRPPQRSLESDFPALGSSQPSTSNTNSTHWKEVLQWTCTKSTPTSSKSKKPAPAPLAPSPPPIESGEAFPSLSKPSKSQKQSSITVVPTWVQPQTSQNASASTSVSNTNIDLIKGKSKRKKAKQISNNNNSNNDLTNLKSNSSSNSNMKKENKQGNLSVKNKETVSKSVNAFSDIEVQKDDRSMKKEKNKNKSEDSSSCSTTINNFESNTNGIQRKRTELKIENLSINNNFTSEDFPALGSTNSKPSEFMSPPPGFSMTTAPPGFSSTTAPPGFAVNFNGFSQLQNSNGLTFTNSSGESYSILPDSMNQEVSTYVPPPDFQKRNKNLVAKVNENLVDQEKIEGFRYISNLYRQGSCDAKSYYKQCREVMGPTTFETLFPELLVLLPDIEKQQDLYKVHKKEVGNKAKNLEACASCGQVLKNGNDFRTHMSTHTLENHFPALKKMNTPVKNTWVRK